jgi:hypothetical protein
MVPKGRLPSQDLDPLSETVPYAQAKLLERCHKDSWAQHLGGRGTLIS